MNYPTWSDLNNESVIPPLGARRAPQAGSVAVLVSCEPDFKMIRSSFASQKVQPFFTSTLIIPGDDKGICIAGPFIGAPYAAMILESLIARGVKQVVMVGWCGAVRDDIAVGDLIIPQKAIVDEGTSVNYIRLEGDPPCSRPDQELGDRLIRILDPHDAVVKQVPVWTTDAIYRETPKKVAWFRDKGAGAVEMECSALFSVARFRNVPITAVLAVSDSVAEKKWDPGFRKKQFKQARKTACRAAMELAGVLSKDG